MKLINLHLLTLFFATASLHAMNQNIEITELDNHSQHQTSVITLFRNTFSKADLPESLTHKYKPHHHETVDIVLHYPEAPKSLFKTCRQKPHDAFCGFMIHRNIESDRVEDITKCYDYVLPEDVNRKFKIVSLDFLAIKPELRNTKGFGSTAIKNLEANALDQNYDYISLQSTVKATGFYTKYGYIATTMADAHNGPSMVKALNSDAQSILTKILSADLNY